MASKDHRCRIDYLEIVDCIVGALDAKDPYTAGHSVRVSQMALRICELIGLNAKHEETIHVAARLHDIGKIGVSDSILQKQGKFKLIFFHFTALTN